MALLCPGTQGHLGPVPQMDQIDHVDRAIVSFGNRMEDLHINDPGQEPQGAVGGASSAADVAFDEKVRDAVGSETSDEGVGSSG